MLIDRRTDIHTHSHTCSSQYPAPLYGRSNRTTNITTLILVVLAHQGCPGQNPESHKTAVCVCSTLSWENLYPTTTQYSTNKNPRSTIWSCVHNTAGICQQDNHFGGKKSISASNQTVKKLLYHRKSHEHSELHCKATTVDL